MHGRARSCAPSRPNQSEPTGPLSRCTNVSGTCNREALSLLLTLSSGVKGYTTIHAGSARQALTRLRFICQLAETSSEIPMSALNTLVSEAIDVVVHCARTSAGLRVTEIICVEELAGGADATHFTTTEVFARPRHDRALAWTGGMPSRAARALKETGHDLRTLLGSRGWDEQFDVVAESRFEGAG